MKILKGLSLHYYALFMGIMGFLLFAPAATSQTVTGDSWSTVQRTKSGTISIVYVETPGFVYRDAQGSLTGVCIDIMEDFVEYVQREHNINLRINYEGDGSSFSNMYETTKSASGGVFGVGNITITEARKSEVKFSPYYIENFAILITGNRVPTLENMEDISRSFAGMTAYTPQGTLNENRIQQVKQDHWTNMPISRVSSSPEALAAVVNDPKGFAYLDLAFYVDAIKTRKPVKRHPVGDDSSEKFGFIMPLNSDWGPVMESFFAEGNYGYRETVAYKRILMEHLGQAAVKLIQVAK